jgi:hypothetical protein
VTSYSASRFVTTRILQTSCNVVSQIATRPRDNRTGKFAADDFTSQLPSSGCVYVVEVGKHGININFADVWWNLTSSGKLESKLLLLYFNDEI